MPVREDRSDVTRFGHVDATGDAGSLIAFLDAANALAGSVRPSRSCWISCASGRRAVCSMSAAAPAPT